MIGLVNTPLGLAAAARMSAPPSQPITSQPGCITRSLARVRPARFTALAAEAQVSVTTQVSAGLQQAGREQPQAAGLGAAAGAAVCKPKLLFTPSLPQCACCALPDLTRTKCCIGNQC